MSANCRPARPWDRLIKKVLLFVGIVCTLLIINRTASADHFLEDYSCDPSCYVQSDYSGTWVSANGHCVIRPDGDPDPNSWFDDADVWIETSVWYFCGWDDTTDSSEANGYDYGLEGESHAVKDYMYPVYDNHVWNYCEDGEGSEGDYTEEFGCDAWQW